MVPERAPPPVADAQPHQLVGRRVVIAVAAGTCDRREAGAQAGGKRFELASRPGSRGLRRNPSLRLAAPAISIPEPRLPTRLDWSLDVLRNEVARCPS